MSWRVSLDCTKAEAEALPDAGELFPELDNPPVLVADEPERSSPTGGGCTPISTASPAGRN